MKIFVSEKSRHNSILKLETDVCHIASHQHMIHIENSCAQFFKTDSMESAMNTVVSIHLSHVCKYSESLTVYGSVKKNLMALCFVSVLILVKT